jgi:hypothetical protein
MNNFGELLTVFIIGAFGGYVFQVIASIVSAIWKNAKKATEAQEEEKIDPNASPLTIWWAVKFFDNKLYFEVQQGDYIQRGQDIDEVLAKMGITRQGVIDEIKGGIHSKAQLIDGTVIR